MNIKLASMLTGYTIDVYRDTPSRWTKTSTSTSLRTKSTAGSSTPLKNMGCVTAKNVLNTPRQVLIDQADLEEDTVDNVIAVLKAEFEDEPETESEPESESEGQETL